MKQEAKETLEKQLQLLSERSNEATPQRRGSINSMP